MTRRHALRAFAGASVALIAAPFVRAFGPRAPSPVTGKAEPRREDAPIRVEGAGEFAPDDGEAGNP